MTEVELLPYTVDTLSLNNLQVVKHELFDASGIIVIPNFIRIPSWFLNLSRNLYHESQICVNIRIWIAVSACLTVDILGAKPYQPKNSGLKDRLRYRTSRLYDYESDRRRIWMSPIDRITQSRHALLLFILWAGGCTAHQRHHGHLLQVSRCIRKWNL